LVSWNGFPTPEHRDILQNHDFGDASFGIGHQFASNLGKVVDKQCKDLGGITEICYDPIVDIEFDVNVDDGSPGSLPPNTRCNPPSDPEPEPEPEPEPKRPDLRVLPLGDSITNGFGSTNDAGYRGAFYNLATENADNVVDMIGSVRSGDAKDADHEGHNGAKIADISSFAEPVLPQRPNVVLLHAGTNDMGSDANAVGAVNRLMSLVDMIITKCPDATLLVARITPSTNSGTQARINAFNDGVEDALKSRADDGKKVLVMYMDEALSTADLGDGLHPNDLGYIKMAAVWWDGVQQAFKKNWIKEPVAGQPPDNGSGGVVCGKVPTWLPQGTVASGGGQGSAALDNNATGVFMADIDGDGRDDYLHVSKDGEVYMYWNVGKAPDSGPNAAKVQWKPIGIIASGGGAKGHQVRFADIDGDGRAEFIWVKDSGSATVWWNRGFSSDGEVKVIWGSGGGEEIATGIGDGQGKSPVDFIHYFFGLNHWILSYLLILPPICLFFFSSSPLFSPSFSCSLFSSF
jgi:lysophospholipase L1-like esterase